jgi:hypothetical protein
MEKHLLLIRNINTSLQRTNKQNLQQQTKVNKSNEPLTWGFAIVGLDGRTISSYTQFSFSSSLTEFYQSFVINFIKSFSIGLRFQADGILFPHHRKALFVGGKLGATH